MGGFCNLSSGSVLGAALSLAVTTMGAGILTLPSAFADAGVFPAMILLLFVAYITVYSVDFIVQSVEKLGLNSYEEITRELLGKHAEEIVRWMLLIYNIGSAIGYLVVIEDLFEPMQPLITFYVPFLTTPKHTLLVLWTFIILPMSCIPKLGALHISSFLAIFGTCLISAMIVFRFFVPGPTQLSPTLVVGPGGVVETSRKTSAQDVRWWLGRHPLLALPIIMFSFDCQSLVFQIYAGLDDMSRHTMFIVSTLSLLVSGGIHAAVGLFGYLTNPLDVKDNVISNYDPNRDALFAVGYIIYAIPINLAFVILLFPIRDSIFILWYGYSSASAATHVPRRRDFLKIVDEEERLDEQLSMLEGESAIGLAATAKTALVSLKNSFTGSRFGGFSASVTPMTLRPAAAPTISPLLADGAPSYGAVSRTAASHDHDALLLPTSAIADMAAAGQSVGSCSNAADAEMIERARSEQAQLRALKKQHNDVEVIPLRDHLIVSITISTVCMAVALVIPGIVSVVALLGGLCSSTLCFTCPALYRYMLNREGHARFKSAWEWSIMAVMLIFGVVGGFLGTVTAVKMLFL